MRFWQSWSRRRSREAELERELRSHIDLEAEEQVDAGMAPEDARYAAQRALGNATQIKEDVRVRQPSCLPSDFFRVSFPRGVPRRSIPW